jgi:hypothetical protein
MSNPILSETAEVPASEFWTPERTAMVVNDMERGARLLGRQTWAPDSSHPKGGRWLPVKGSKS